MEQTESIGHHPLLEHTLEFTPYIKGLLGSEYGIYVANLESFLCCNHGVIKLSIQPGDPVKETSLTGRCLKSGKRVVDKTDKEVYGIPYIGIAYPLTDPKTHLMIGVMTIILPSRQDELIQIADLTEEEVNVIAASVEQFSASAEELSASTQDFKAILENIRNEVRKTDNVIALINTVAKQTQLLGLNAAIEAARAGASGKGFSVVAEQIRKLAEHTQGSVNDVVNTLTAIQKAIDNISSVIEQMAAGTEEQAASSQSINSSVHHLKKLANDLKFKADNLVK